VIDDDRARPPVSVWAPPDPRTRLADAGSWDAARHNSSAGMPVRRRGLRSAALFALVAFVVSVLGGSAIGSMLRSGDDTGAVGSSVRTPTTTPEVTAPAGTSPAVTIPPALVPDLAPAPSGTLPAPQPDVEQDEDRSAPDLARGVGVIDVAYGYEGGRGAGTGIVLSADGDMLTSYHVVEDATQIVVTILSTGERYEASVLGGDETRDIALIRLDGASGLTPARIGDSSAVEVGDVVTAAGNAGGTGTLTTSPGGVAALGQTITATDSSGRDAETLFNLIEVSAVMLPGQSGGPLLDADGDVIGVNAAGSSRNLRFQGTEGTGIGYAVPINEAMEIVAAVRSGEASGTIRIGTPPMLGVLVRTDVTGLLVVDGVAAGGPAEASGIRAGDGIVSVDGNGIDTIDDLTAALRARDAGDTVTVEVTRSGEILVVTAELVAGPA
jgi:S1-C subfamily serine protease